MKIDLNNLEQVAQKANVAWDWPDMWKAFHECANPAVVLELVRRLRAAEQDAKRYQYLKATTTAIRYPGTGEREECGPDLFESAVDLAIAAQGASHD